MIADATEAAMTPADGPDPRSRVIKAAMGGLSARQASQRFGVGLSPAIVWVRRYRQSGAAAGQATRLPS